MLPADRALPQAASALTLTVSMPSKVPEAFVRINLLRAFAALLVLGYHVTTSGRWLDMPQDGPWVLVWIGWIGVDLFYVISGFVIALSALRLLDENPQTFRPQFLLRRLARIFPLYMLTCVAYVLFVNSTLLSEHWGTILWQVISHAAFLHNLDPATAGAINPPTWTIANEFQFYLVIAAVMPWLVRHHCFGVFAVGLALFSLGYRWFTTWLLPPGQSPVSEQLFWVSQLPGVIDQFLLGWALAVFYFQQRHVAQKLLSSSWFTGVCAALFVGLLLLALKLPTDYWAQRWVILTWRQLLSIAFLALLTCVISIQCAPRWFERPLLYLGEISYGVYLWHMLVMEWVLWKMPGLKGPEFAGVILVATLALSTLTWHFIERPCLTWARRAKSFKRGSRAPACTVGAA